MLQVLVIINNFIIPKEDDHCPYGLTGTPYHSYDIFLEALLTAMLLSPFSSWSIYTALFLTNMKAPGMSDPFCW